MRDTISSTTKVSIELKYMQRYGFHFINIMVSKNVHSNRMLAPKAFKWGNKSSHNFAYISNISTYKQFSKRTHRTLVPNFIKNGQQL